MSRKPVHTSDLMDTRIRKKRGIKKTEKKEKKKKEEKGIVEKIK